MPVNKEFTIRLEDRPGTLGKVCQALADQNVNILAFQQLPLEKGKGAVRLVLDNPAAAKTTLDQQRADYTETEVAQINLSHRTGELARAASRLGEAGININYGCCQTIDITRFRLKSSSTGILTAGTLVMESRAPPRMEPSAGVPISLKPTRFAVTTGARHTHSEQALREKFSPTNTDHHIPSTRRRR